MTPPNVKSHKSTPDSQVCLGGKTLSKMREIADGVFMEWYASIILSRDRRYFIVFVDKDVPKRTLEFFKAKYPQCKVKFCEDA